MHSYHVTDFTKPVSSKGLSIFEIDISPVEMEMYIDLQPFVNPAPYMVPEDMSLTKVSFCYILNLNIYLLIVQ
jgi:chloride channel 7